jgi:predicted nucleotide-binding protein (sugar kinase/HSP70/actin superfamily)
VAILGDLYVRDNHIFNQNLIRTIESQSIEVIPTPYNYLIRMMAAKHFRHLEIEKKYMPLFFEKTLLRALLILDKKYYQIASDILKEDLPKFDKDLSEILSKYYIMQDHPGETSMNIEKIFHLIDHYPDIQLFIHVNPVFCCPALISESVFKRVEQDIGIPIVSILYDGTQSQQNRILRPYLHYIKQAFERSQIADNERVVIDLTGKTSP